MTKIEWVKNPDGSPGYTWNPITGCLNHVNGMCKGGNFPCYAYKLANGRLRTRYLANKNLTPDYLEMKKAFDRNTLEPFQDPFYPRFWLDRLEEPVGAYRTTKCGYLWKPHISRGIFCCDMSDLFGIGIPEVWTRQVLNTIDYCVPDRFYLLTKQPQNLVKFSPFPDNCWVGVTATNPQMFYEAQEYLEKIVATVRYISLEPFLERIWTPQINSGVIDGLIIGAQTKPYKPPKIECLQEIVEAADKTGIPVFLKDNLLPIINYPQHRWAWSKYPLRKDDKGISVSGLRQEMPKGSAMVQA